MRKACPPGVGPPIGCWGCRADGRHSVRDRRTSARPTTLRKEDPGVAAPGLVATLVARERTGEFGLEIDPWLTCDVDGGLVDRPAGESPW